ncbi:hypothetical protein DEF23_12010 [Marinitenerispora sediminis]|uniref:Uncharacterized protein n=1 Tax=Marinitenerispora sediminis TaxID=1931232 RepID=A0A368T0Z7_9ACTN|nr:hypothetical protein DEF24_21080 [Marinitenerispora sediminis]RCV55689.1 hypothetical protein DEF28_05205 [Marinitenerispora sediminis]RCV56710.1 hypothetical protein DEF23_12010 [Marinitenerispora sediminis]
MDTLRARPVGEPLLYPGIRKVQQPYGIRSRLENGSARVSARPTRQARSAMADRLAEIEAGVSGRRPFESPRVGEATAAAGGGRPSAGASTSRERLAQRRRAGARTTRR